MSQRDTFVYRYSDDERDVYVGMTRHPRERDRSHRRAKWHNDDLRMHLLGPMPRHVALEKEREWMWKYKPAENRIGRPPLDALSVSDHRDHKKGRQRIAAPPARPFVEAAGGSAIVARACGVTRQSTHNWRVIPDKWVLVVEELLGGKYTRYDMRPDIFGESPERAA